MAAILLESSIERVSKVVKSRVKDVLERKSRDPSMERPLDHRHESPSRKVFELFFARPARRTVSLLYPGRTKAIAVETQDEVDKSPTLGERFFSLPVELQLNIVNLLFFFDLLNLRKTSRDFRNLTLRHESHIVRHHINMWVPTRITKLYPPPTVVPPKLTYLTDLAYKQRVSTELALALANQVVKEMVDSRQSRSRRMTKEENDFVLSQLQLGMAPLIFALFHFLETYRERKLEHLLQIDYAAGPSKMLGPLSHEKNMAIQSEILKHYPDELLLQVHQMYHLLLHLLLRRLNPVALPFGVRTLGRWNAQRPTNQAFAKLLVLGGIREVWELYRIKGYSRRRRAFDKYLKKLDSGEKTQSYPKSGHTPELISTVASGSAGRTVPGRGPSLDIPSKLARLDVDELMDVWTPAAEERLLSREIVGSLDEVGCCGQFVSQLLGSTAESDESDDGDEEGSEDGDDSGDDAAIQGVAGMHYIGGATGDDSAWEDDDLTEGEHDDDDYGGSFGDDEQVGASSS